MPSPRATAGRHLDVGATHLALRLFLILPYCTPLVGEKKKKKKHLRRKDLLLASAFRQLLWPPHLS